MASLGTLMMEEFPPTDSVSCPALYWTSAPLLPGMLRGAPGRPEAVVSLWYFCLRCTDVVR